MGTIHATTIRPVMIIYKIINQINGKVYIGQTIYNLEQRMSDHLRHKRKQPISVALRKYDIQSFAFSTIDNASSKEVLDAKERYWIKQYNCKAPNGYNLTDGGEGTYGFHHSEETRRKLSAASTGEKGSCFGRTGEKHPLFGKKHTPETIKKMRAAKTGEKNNMWGKTGEKNPLFGRHHSAETCRKIALVHLGVKHGKYCEVLI